MSIIDNRGLDPGPRPPAPMPRPAPGSCDASQHDFLEGNASESEDRRKPVIYCHNCGEVRRLEDPKAAES